MTIIILNPGSKEAIAAGCKCPVIDNHYGKGVPINGKREFWYSEECKLHKQSREFNVKN